MTANDGASIARGFLFADLRGYSAFVERRGDRAGVQLLTAYRDVVRRVVPRFNGAEIRTEGDSFYVVFTSPSSALECGLAILDEARRSTIPDGTKIAVGIGVHAGETMELDDGYVGSAVNIAARLCSIAAAGELLTSEAVRSLTRSYLDVLFISVGHRRLKGIAGSVPVYRVLPAGATPSRRMSIASWIRQAPVRVAGIGVLAAFLLGSSVVVATLMREGLGSETPQATSTQSPLRSAGSGVIGPPVETLVPDASALPGDNFPTSGEADLMALVEDQYHRTCARAGIDDRPVYTDVRAGARDEVPVPVSAGITCSPVGVAAPDELAFWAIPDRPVSAEILIFNMAGARAAVSGACDEALPARGAWSIGRLSGQLFCFADPAPVIYWTYDDAHVLGRASRFDGDMDALLAWWRDEARHQQP